MTTRALCERTARIIAICDCGDGKLSSEVAKSLGLSVSVTSGSLGSLVRTGRLERIDVAEGYHRSRYRSTPIALQALASAKAYVPTTKPEKTKQPAKQAPSRAVSIKTKPPTSRIFHGAPVVTSKTKITIAPTPPDRWAVTNPPSVIQRGHWPATA